MVTGAEQTVRLYICENLFPPGQRWPVFWRKRRVNERWAATELLERLHGKTEAEAVDTAKTFCREMARYAAMSSTPDGREIFLSAAAVAEDILSALKGETHDEE